MRADAYAPGEVSVSRASAWFYLTGVAGDDRWLVVRVSLAEGGFVMQVTWSLNGRAAGERPVWSAAC